MTYQTIINQELNEHKYTNGGTKTVCVSTCLNFFGIRPSEYHYTSSNNNIYSYKNVLRRFGYSVRSRRSMFKIKKSPTMTSVKRMMRKSDYTQNDYFIVSGCQSRKAHLMVMNGNGEIIIDTAPNSRWKVRDISIVER